MRILDIEYFRTHMEEVIEGLKPGESFLLSVEEVPKVRVIALTDAERERLHDETQTEATPSPTDKEESSADRK
jgi:antitoxin (DNA-binding transcriptional repressor) of toxin-antitoxin stability system